MQYGRLELTSETALIESELFQGLTPDQVDRLASLATTVTAEPKDTCSRVGKRPATSTSSFMAKSNSTWTSLPGGA